MQNKTYGIVALLVCATLGMTTAPLAAASHTIPPACPAVADASLTFGTAQSGSVDSTNHVRRYDITLSAGQPGQVRFWDPTATNDPDMGKASFVVYALSGGTCGTTPLAEGTLTATEVPQGRTLPGGASYAIVAFANHDAALLPADFEVKVAAPIA